MGVLHSFHPGKTASLSFGSFPYNAATKGAQSSAAEMNKH